MGKDKITAKQQQILDYIKGQITDRGFPPSVREIGEAVQLKSTSSVHAHLEALEKHGLIRKDPTKPRTIEVLDPDFRSGIQQNSASDELIPEYTDYASVPVVGEVAAGQPLLAAERIESYFPIPTDRLPNAQTFLLKVRGESMVNAGILSGDYVLVEQTSVARNGQIVVALIDDSATVKTFYKEKGHYRLQPENDYMEPIIVRDGELQVLGCVIGVFRFFR